MHSAVIGRALMRYSHRIVSTRRVRVALRVMLVAAASACVRHQSTLAAGRSPSFRLMPDGKQWLTRNLSLAVPGSSCYRGEAQMCPQYGRLYTWDAAQEACRAVGRGWRLPTDNEWGLLAKAYGGVDGESADSGKGAYRSLAIGGRSEFNAMLGGGADAEAHVYSRVDAHGFYWTASASGVAGATFMNFAGEGQALHRQPDGDKQRAFSVRCVRDTSEGAPQGAARRSREAAFSRRPSNER